MEENEIRVGDIIHGLEGECYVIRGCIGPITFTRADDTRDTQPTFALARNQINKYYTNHTAIIRRKIEIWKSMKSE